MLNTISFVLKGSGHYFGHYLYISLNMSYSIILDYRTGTKKSIKKLRIRVRNTAAQIDVRKVTGIKVLESHFNYEKQTLSVECLYKQAANIDLITLLE